MKGRIKGLLGYVEYDIDGDLVIALDLKTRSTAPERDCGLARDLRRYLRGERVDFTAYDVSLDSYTDFERSVMLETRRIPYAETRTYAQVAAAIGKSAAARAVGNALGKNNTSVIVPCHRVVASDGLGGFTGGIAWKVELLRLEGVL